MATKFTKGGILNSSQLEDISGKKWKKGGILSAEQLNELSGGKEGVSIKSIPIKVVNNSGGIVQAYYVNMTDGKISYKQLYQYANVAEATINCCAFEYLWGPQVYYAIPFAGSFANKTTDKVNATSKSGTELYIRGPVIDSIIYNEYIQYNGTSIPDDEMITITVDA